MRNFFKKDYDAADIRQSIDAAVSVRVMEPVFEIADQDQARQPRHRAERPEPCAASSASSAAALDNYLHKNKETAEALKRRSRRASGSAKSSAGIRGLARDRAKKASLHNKKLRDCRIHLGDEGRPRAEESTLFIVEGRQRRGHHSRSRDVQTQAVFA
jgi:topoisomerase-4 subunit B